MIDELLVVGGDRCVAGTAERALDEADVRGVHVRLLRIGDLRRLEVGALDEAQVRLEGKERLKVVLGPVEIRLEDGPDVGEPRLAEPAVDVERLVHDRRVLHVDPDEVAELG